MAQLKAFTASYSDHWAYGGYETLELVVVPNTESEALGLVLEKYADKPAKNWFIHEIDLSKISIEEISQSGS